MDFMRVTMAYRIAGDIHASQRRKGNGEPYINHPMRVASMVADSTSEEDVVIAAVLHDVIEDGDISFDDIESRFGSRVRVLLEGVTDDPSIKNMQRSERKEAQAQKLRFKCSDVKLIKLADQTDNIESLLASLGAWDAEKARVYASTSICILNTCQEASNSLHARAMKAIDEVNARLDDISSPTMPDYA